MMKRNLLLLLILSTAQIARSCDICSCGSGGAISGVMPQFHKNIITLQHQFSQFNHPFTEKNTLNGQSVLNDQFNRTSLAVRYYLNPRLQLMGRIPYARNLRTMENDVEQINGLSDIDFSVGYLIFNTTDSIYRPFRHLLMLGAGTSLPVGKYQMRNADKLMFPNNFQPGSGAWTPQMNLMYSLRYRSWGLSLQSNLFFPTENELAYQRGQSGSHNLYLVYWKTFNRTKVLPHVSCGIDHLKADHSFGRKEPYTGGHAVFAGAGLDVIHERLAVNLAIQRAMVQEVGHAQPSADIRLAAGLGLFF